MVFLTHAVYLLLGKVPNLQDFIKLSNWSDHQVAMIFSNASLIFAFLMSGNFFCLVFPV